MHDLAALARLDAIAQADLVVRREISAAEHFSAWRARFETLNPILRAVVTRVEEVPRVENGPLSAVPFLVKDSFPWPGLHWAMASSALAHQRKRVGSRHATYQFVVIGPSPTS